jgi:hypothetical protein
MQAELTVRRARREDFVRVRALLGETAPGARADRKRFRRLVSTLREDLYLAERVGDARLAGLAVIAYVRGLGPTTAIVRDLQGSDEARRLLLACAEAHAAAHGCARLEVHGDLRENGAENPGGGWQHGPRIHARPVTA